MMDYQTFSLYLQKVKQTTTFTKKDYYDIYRITKRY